MISPKADQSDIVYSCTATCFGSDADAGQDNGVGAWGVPYRAIADRCDGYPYCALPVRTPSIPSLKNSPLPAGIPHGTMVHIFLPSTGKATWAIYSDLGPTQGLSSGAGVDLSPYVVQQLGYQGDAEDFEEEVNVRIIGCGSLLG